MLGSMAPCWGEWHYAGECDTAGEGGTVLGRVAPYWRAWHHARRAPVPVSCRMQQGTSTVSARSCSPMAPWPQTSQSQGIG